MNQKPSSTAELTSACFDGEASGAERAQWLDALRQDRRGDMRATWASYDTLGAAMRSVPGDFVLSKGFCDAFSARLRDEPTVLVPAVASAERAKAANANAAALTPTFPSPPAAQWQSWALVASLVAVGVLGWVALRTLPLLTDTSTTIAASAVGGSAQRDVRAPSGAAVVSLEDRVVLKDYLHAHQEVAMRARLSGMQQYIQPASTGQTH